MTERSPRRRLARRLLASHGLVIAAGAVTLAVVALLVGPPLFHAHVGRALGPLADEPARHLDEALSTSLLLSLGIAVAAAALTAFAVSWTLSSRIARPIEDLSATAEDLAAGHLSVRAPPPPVDDELGGLTATFNRMATSLEQTEDTRRRLLSDVAHELRTPLSTIEAYVEGLRDGVVEPAEETWTVLQGATDRLQRLVDDIAFVSRAEEGALDLQLGPADVDALVSQVLAAARDGYERAGIDLDADVEAGLPPVRVDPERIGQVLSNLLDNARRHTPAGGCVVVRARGRDGAVAIEVVDTGEGIAPDDLSHVFERFFRGDAARGSGGGSGIGLTIARAIAVAHGGSLAAHTAGPGRGSTFTLTLPPEPSQPGSRT